LSRSETLILGIGSPEPEDRIGWEAAEGLRPLAESEPGLGIEICDRPGVGLLEYFRRAPNIILVDAMRAGGSPGSVEILRAEQLCSTPTFSSHGVGVAEAVALAEALGELPSRLVIIGIEAGGDPALVVPRIGEEVQRLLASYST